MHPQCEQGGIEREQQVEGCHHFEAVNLLPIPAAEPRLCSGAKGDPRPEAGGLFFEDVAATVFRGSCASASARPLTVVGE